MKRVVFTAVVALIVALSARAQDPGQVFEQANQLYQGSRFDEARDAYESLVKNGYVSGELYYNLGNTYYKLGDLPRALLNYERAVRVMPDDPDLLYNLQLVGMMTTDRIEPAPRLFLWDYWDAVKGMFSANGILWFTYAAFLLLFVPAGMLVMGRSYSVRKTGLISLAVMLPLFLLSFTICINRISDLSRTDMGIVTATVTSVKNSPDANSTDAFVLHSGAKVTITDHIGTWLQIRIADGKTGWMEEGALEVI